MDPNETLRLLVLALAAQNFEEADEHYAHLKDWVARGGFVDNDLVRFHKKLDKLFEE